MAWVIPLKLFRNLSSGTEYFNNDPKPWEEPNNAWRGIDYNLTVPPASVEPIWIGVSSNGESTQVFPISTTVKNIRKIWARVYQGTKITLLDGSVLAFSDQYSHVLSDLKKCCLKFIRSGPFVFKISNKTLKPGADFPCETEAGFKWLAVLGTEDPPVAYTRFFEIELKNAAETLVLSGELSSGTLVDTIQTVLNWPEDFIGLTIDGTTIVANDVIAGIGEVNIGEFDFGTITVRTRMTAAPDIELIAENEWSLPDTTCADDSSSVSDSGEFAEAEFTEEFNI
jgi:hypothetical protein